MPELDDAALERRLRAVLQENLGPLPLDLTVDALDRRREARRVARGLGRRRGITLLAAAAVLGGGALAAGSGTLRLPSVVPPVPAPSVVAVATGSPDATSPNSTPTFHPSLSPLPSDPIGPLAWTEARVKQDWPAPVRAEPPGGAAIVPILHRDLTPNAASDESHQFESDQYRDPTGDTGSDIYPSVDIRWVEYCRDNGLSIGSVTDSPHAVDPRQLWIASGVVVDSDGDGVPDWRYGVDNVPLDATDSQADRWWRTDLHTGRTDWAVGDHITLSDGGRGPIFWGGPGCDMSFGAETTGGGPASSLPERFYAWASVIVNGRVVATDYAPDVGWLDRSSDAKPLPKPGGPYVVQDLRDPDRGPSPRLSMTLTDGWTLHDYPDLTRGNTVLHFQVLDKTDDSCTDTTEPLLGPGLDGLVSYFSARPDLAISETRYGTVGDYRSAYLEYRAGQSGCSPRAIPVGDYNDAWIIDAAGVPLVIVATYESPPVEAIRTDVRQIVASIEITGVSPSVPASPSPTAGPTPEPTPRPTPLAPTAGPVPPNPRTWTVTVENKSSEPAALFVAEEDQNGLLRLVGSASPNVVQGGATVTVTFLFPADGGWIYVNPRPGEGGALVNADQIGIPGRIVITADGQEGWLSP